MMDWFIGLFEGRILEWILGALVAFFGWRWNALKAVIRELGDLIAILDQALDDDRLSKEEWAFVAKEAKDVLAAMKELLGR